MLTAISPGAEDVLASGSVRVLVAADDVPARLTLEAVLAKSGYAVDSAASSTEAMERSRPANTPWFCVTYTMNPRMRHPKSSA